MATVEEPDQISLVYDGSLADEGKLHLYEFGRAVYAFSRLVAVVEYYRRSGRVAKKITKDANVNVIVSAPQKGSFLIDAAVYFVSQVLPQLQGIPFDVFFSYILELLMPKSEAREKRIVELAKIQLAEERQRTAQSKEETKRLQILADAIQNQSLLTKEALDTVRWAVGRADVRIGRANFTQEELIDLEDEYESRVEREEILKAHRDKLKNIPTEDIRKLTTRVRPLVGEVGLPLRKSAKRVAFRVKDGEANRKIMRVDLEGLANLSDQTLEGDIVALQVKFKAYDRESGWGKVRAVGTGQILPFLITAADRVQLAELVAQGLTEKENTITAHSYVNKSGEVTSLVLISVV